MEKLRPTLDLRMVKATLGAIETLAVTSSALRDAAALGFDRHAICETVASIELRMFHKSMTTFADHRVWQDVYHVPFQDLVLYVKFQDNGVTDFMPMSFKER